MAELEAHVNSMKAAIAQSEQAMADMQRNARMCDRLKSGAIAAVLSGRYSHPRAVPGARARAVGLLDPEFPLPEEEGESLSELRWRLAAYVVPAKPSVLRAPAAPRFVPDPHRWLAGIAAAALLGWAFARSARKGGCD